jgi:hypothetical protein
MTNDLIERLNMIVAELQGLPHVVQTCREAAAHIEAQAERVRDLEEEAKAAAALLSFPPCFCPEYGDLSDGREDEYEAACLLWKTARQARKDKENG